MAGKLVLYFSHRVQPSGPHDGEEGMTDTIFRGIRGRSEECVTRFKALREMAGMPATMIVVSAGPTDPVEVWVCEGVELPRPGLSFLAEPRRR